MPNAELDKVTAEEFMLSWVLAATTEDTFHANLCRKKKLTWELFEEISALSDIEKMRVQPSSTTAAVNTEDTAALGKPRGGGKENANRPNQNRQNRGDGSNRGNNQRGCAICGKRGHDVHKCRHVTCSTCGKTGHSKKCCYSNIAAVEVATTSN